MPDLGDPSSYVMLEAGAAVYSSDGEQIGRVAEVRRALDEDIFDGIVVDRGATHGGKSLVLAEQVDEIFERGVLLKLDSAAAASLPAA